MGYGGRCVGIRVTDLTSPADVLTVEERLALLEARLAGPAPQAVVPPITIGSLTNVPVPGGQIAAQWAQDVTSIALHRFASKASLNAWAPPNGALAVTMDNGLVFHRVTGAWAQYTPWSGSVPGIAWAAPTNVETSIAAINIPTDPGPRRASLHVALRVDILFNQVTYVRLYFDGGLQCEAVVDTTGIANPGGFMIRHVALSAGDLSVPAGRAVGVGLTIRATNAFSSQTYAGPVSSRLDVLVTPDGH